jgi:hypothetical protein
MLRGEFGGVLVEFLNYSERIGPFRGANPVVTEHCDVDAGFFLFSEQSVEIEDRFGRFRMKPTLRH